MKNKINTRNKVLILTLILMSLTVQSIPLKLSDEPLFLNQAVPPALAITFDDSGSMAWGFMPDSRPWWNAPSLSSPDYNFIYYNPNIDYRPPVRSDGTPLPNSDFFNAKFDGFSLNNDLIPRVDLSHHYRYLYYSYPNYNNGTTDLWFLDAGRPEGPAFYHRWNGPANTDVNVMVAAGVGPNLNQYTYVQIGPEEEQNFANWYTYYNTRGKLARAAVSHAFVNFGPDFKIDWQQINNLQFPLTGGTNMKVFSGSHRQDFYDWLFTIPPNGGTPLRQSFSRAGTLFEKKGIDGPYYDQEFGAELSCQQNFHIAISDGTWNGWATVGGNPDNTATNLPIMPDGTTRYNYSPGSLPSKMYHGDEDETLADHTFEYWRRDLRPDLPNQVPGFIEDYTDRFGNTIVVDSDKQWWEYPELFWNPHNDPANWQHMVNFSIGLGIQGSLDRNTALPNIRDGSIAWPSIGTNGGLVDDVWHSSVNSRGKYFSARDPAELVSSLNKLVTNIIKRKGRASAGSVSSNIISDETLAFKTGYDTAEWSGFVVAQKINLDGSLGDVLWDAACLLTGGPCPTMPGNPIVNASRTDGTRNIFTYDHLTKSQHPFHTINMSRIEQDAILNSPFFLNQQNTNDPDPFAVPTPFDANDIIRYIRGNRENEQQNGGIFRSRKNLLGDVIHSPAKIIRGPAESYDDSIWSDGSPERLAADSGLGYSSFRAANKNRDNILIVGANDGMLHAFNAGINTTNGGDEIWAYIPSKALEGISELANPAYQHKSFVDSTVFVKDAYINLQWRTVALGGMRKGGKLFYALDLGSDPKNMPRVMWEFTDQDDPDMGYSYAGGVIARVSVPLSQSLGSTGMQSKWVAFVPNGYNSTNQRSVMYAIDLETGELLHKWDTGVGSYANPNGMGAPVAADFVAYDSNDTSINIYGADQGTDFIYAGDLHGNVYRFDTSDIFTGNNSIELLYQGSLDNPITVAPRLFTPDDGSDNIVVVFGTGKYIEVSDRSIATTPTQYLLGLKDSRIPITSPYSLNDARIVEQKINESGGFRTLTNNTVLVDQGWKVALPVKGERLVNGLGRNNQTKLLIAGTIIPNGGDPCLSGGFSWLMLMDARTGGAPINGSLLNNNTADGILVNDLITGVNVLTTQGGNRTIINIDGANSGNGGGSNSSDVVIDLDAGEKWRRRSWHRILFD